jgi:hypothetical protein
MHANLLLNEGSSTNNNINVNRITIRNSREEEEEEKEEEERMEWLVVPPEGSEFVVDWVWMPRGDPDLFIGGTAPGRTIKPLDWPLMTIRVDFSR